MGLSCNGIDDGLDPRVRRTRKLLHDALGTLGREKPFAAITIQEIAERATVNRATFYAHYASKEALLESVLKEGLHDTLIGRFAERPAATPENLVEIAVVVFEFLAGVNAGCPESAEEHRQMIGTAVQEALYEMIARWLSNGYAYRRLFPGIPMETAAAVISWSIFGSAHDWSRQPVAQRPPVRRRCEEIVAVLLPQDGK